jgi:hypothetical protein
MKPTKNKKRPAGPDPVPGEAPSEEIGGTDLDEESPREPGIVDTVEGDEGSGGGYGRPRAQDDPSNDLS